MDIYFLMFCRVIQNIKGAIFQTKCIYIYRQDKTEAQNCHHQQTGIWGTVAD